MKFASKIAAIYLALGFLTMAHWEFVWLKGAPSYQGCNRTCATLVIGPTIVITWPAYWTAMYRLGPWAWLPSTQVE
jgi:hypothetical protein